MHNCPWHPRLPGLRSALRALQRRVAGSPLTAALTDIVYDHTYTAVGECPHRCTKTWRAVARRACATLTAIRNDHPETEPYIDRAIDILDPRQRYAETVLTVCAVLVSTIVVAAILASWVRAL